MLLCGLTEHQCLVAVFSLPAGFRSSASHIAALPFVKGESRSAFFNAADVQNENAAESTSFRIEIVILI